MSELFQDDSKKLAEHLFKADKLVKYYMENMDTEHGTIREALEYLFTELGTDDLNRAMDDLKLKLKTRY